MTLAFAVFNAFNRGFWQILGPVIAASRPLRTVAGMARQPMPERLHVLGDFGVFENLVRIAQTAHDHATDLVLVLRR